MISIKIKEVWKGLLDKHEPVFLGDVVNTTDLQLESLCAFMSTLGYTPNMPDEVTNIKDFYGEYGFIFTADLEMWRAPTKVYLLREGSFLT